MCSFLVRLVSFLRSVGGPWAGRWGAQAGCCPTAALRTLWFGSRSGRRLCSIWSRQRCGCLGCACGGLPACSLLSPGLVAKERPPPLCDQVKPAPPLPQQLSVSVAWPSTFRVFLDTEDAGPVCPEGLCSLCSGLWNRRVTLGRGLYTLGWSHGGASATCRSKPLAPFCPRRQSLQRVRASR